MTWLHSDYILNFWFIVLNDHWYKRIYRPQMIVDVRCYIHLRWSCFINTSFCHFAYKYDIFKKTSCIKDIRAKTFFIPPQNTKSIFDENAGMSRGQLHKNTFLQRHPWEWLAIEEANKATARKSIASNINWSFFGCKSIDQAKLYVSSSHYFPHHLISVNACAYSSIKLSPHISNISIISISCVEIS